MRVTGQGITTTTSSSGWLYFAPATQQLSCDGAGNVISDSSRWLYHWDAENRLTSMEITLAAISAALTGPQS